MFKKISALVLISIILLGTVGCNKKNVSSSDDYSSTDQISSALESSKVESATTSEVSSETDSSSQENLSSQITSNNSSAAQSKPTVSSAPSAKEESSSVSLNNSMISWFGRSLVEDGTVTLDWSGMGFEICVKGGSVKAQFFALDNGDANCVWIGVYVDNMQIDKIRLQSGTKWYELVKGLPENKVTTVKIVKLSEAQQGVAIMHGLEVDGQLSAPPIKSRKIVWIGDSITAGYGVHTTLSDPFKTETQDITATYGYLISEEFNAQAQFIAASGHGVATSNGGSTTDALIPLIYPKTRFSSSSDAKWDFERFQPDLVVVNLGTNDVAGGSDSQRLKNGVNSFLRDLRKYHPKATIVWTYGFMIDGKLSDIKQEVESFAATDKNTYFIEAKKISGSGETGSAGHPNAAAHERFAKELKNELSKILGW